MNHHDGDEAMGKDNINPGTLAKFEESLELDPQLKSALQNWAMWHGELIKALEAHVTGQEE